MTETDLGAARCPGCYQSFSGPWCDNCDAWPCTCPRIVSLSATAFPQEGEQTGLSVGAAPEPEEGEGKAAGGDCGCE